MHGNLIFIFCLSILLLLDANVVLGQRQLIVTSGDKVVHRFREGDTFHSKWVDDKMEHWGFIVEINEFGMITSQDTIAFKEVRKVLVKGTPFIRKVGINLVKIGTFYFLIDQFNSAVIQKNPGIDEFVWKTSAVLVGTGLPMLLFKRNWKRIGKNYRLKSIGPDSRLYRPD